ncbi:hypothetical protein [Microlunatus sp. Gsoil 973]|uniref:hypothetical protein n=1 Tax=Microlunatus sp. Gsoil 973 TaxID=2672569 RepID=UPI001E521A86|nr:hypothetical protein [Microlunatus sp. Gsoil 973]
MSLNTDVPSRHQIEQLLDVESPGCVSIYAPSTPIGAQVEASRLEFKNLAKEARAQLEQSGMESGQLDMITDELDDLVDDEGVLEGTIPKCRGVRDSGAVPDLSVAQPPAERGRGR